jgi:class 3 adenylate cyclase
MEQDIRFCTTSDGVRIAYAVVGRGPPLVIVRGWVSHLELDWEAPVARQSYEAYSKHFQVVRFDKRGTGLSDRDVDDFSIEARLRDLEAVVDHLKLRRFALSGISEGGPIAMAYTAAYPRHVSHLILAGTFARGTDLGRQKVQEALLALVRAQWGLGSHTLTNVFMLGASREEHDGFTRYQREAASRAGAAAMLEANYRIDVTDMLPKINAPTLVLHAKGDLAVPFSQGRELASSIPGARFVPIESDRHAPDQAAAAIMRETTIQFLTEGEAAPEAPPVRAQPQSDAPLTIVFTDIVNSTALTQRLGDAAAQGLVRAHNAIVREALSAHAGSEIKHTGDGIMASFGSASGALQCAVDIQRAVDGKAAEHLAVHIGINAGEPVAEDDDLFGTAVQLARRVCDQAHSGEILASDVVRQLVAGKGFLFADRGEVALRGFEDPVRLYEVRWQQDAS